MKFMKFLFLLLITHTLFGQLHHQAFALQGKVSAISNGLVVSQSIGQQSIAGTAVNTSYVAQQGFQQSMVVNSVSNPLVPQVTAKFYPNPFVSTITFEFSTEINEEMAITIFDVSGKLVYKAKKTPVQNILTINALESLSDGNYVIVLKAANYHFNAKLIKF